MKKLLILLLIALIFGSISCDFIDECKKATCAKIKEFLKKYGIYDDIVDLLKKGAKKVAQALCEKQIPSGLCSCLITRAGQCFI